MIVSAMEIVGHLVLGIMITMLIVQRIDMEHGGLVGVEIPV